MVGLKVMKHITEVMDTFPLESDHGGIESTGFSAFSPPSLFLLESDHGGIES